MQKEYKRKNKLTTIASYVGKLRIMAFLVNHSGRILIVVLLLWLLIILFFSGSLLKRSDSEYNMANLENAELIMARLSRAFSELDSLRFHNEELESIIKEYLPIDNSKKLSNEATQSNCNYQSCQQFEEVRRRLKFNYNELWYFLHSKIKNSSLFEFIDAHRSNFFYDLELIEERDYEWRKNEFKKLSSLVNQVIKDLQNPKNCDEAQKLICHLDKGCGFGCQIHHVTYCMIVALALNRTFILNTSEWRYLASETNSKINWNHIFKPLSSTCVHSTQKAVSFSKENMNNKALYLSIIDDLNPKPDYIPLSIPKQLSQLITIHGAPGLWFIGQIVKYIMRPSSSMFSFIEKARQKMKFNTPIVGVHVRRTDKVHVEASFHSLSEYMRQVETYYQDLETKMKRKNKNVKIKKLVYLATDDTSIWKTETKPFEKQGYTFIGDSNIAQTAGLLKRYSLDSLKNVILDVIMLSECDHLVCTFSSQICRLAFELMQTRGLNDTEKSRIDWSDAFNSLDDIYYFGGQNPHNQKALIDHYPSNKEEIEIHAGDVIGIAGNHWNGYSKGFNRRTSKSGLFPGFKTTEKILTTDFKAFQVKK